MLLSEVTALLKKTHNRLEASLRDQTPRQTNSELARREAREAREELIEWQKGKSNDEKNMQRNASSNTGCAGNVGHSDNTPSARP